MIFRSTSLPNDTSFMGSRCNVVFAYVVR